MSEVRDIDPGSAHPCRGQKGLFATRAWAAGRVVGEYRGVVRWYRDVADTTYYAGFRADGHFGYGVDATTGGNETRFINHYKGAAAAPNVRFATTGGAGGTSPRIMVLTTAQIAAGDEFLADYGYEC